MRIPGRLQEDHLLGVRFALNVSLGALVTWTALRALDDRNPIWAIASMIASSDPVWTQAKRTFRGRILNAAIGCAVGLAFLLVGGPKAWKLPVALGVTVLLSTYVVRVPVMWRQAPITAAIVIASGVAHQSRLSGVEHGLHKVAEVIFGCLVGVAVSWLMARVWPVAPVAPAQPASPAPPGAGGKPGA
ncbi:MAG TPA: FUSC family protein [Anaeromyxobacteraceae bacterium]|nr:FUSC family protein [Anaeromyxobacteraceae bacterium]